MKDKKNKKKNKEELKEYLKELSNKDSISEDEAERLTDMIDKLVLGSKTERFIAGVTSFVLKLIIFYFVSLVASAFFLNQFLLDRYYIFLIAGCTAFLFALAETITGLFIKKGIYGYLVSIIAIFAIAYISNSIIPTFTFGSIWIVYLLLVVVIYNLLMITIFRRKFKI